MHPAYSVILFTTASGAGYGLLGWLGLAIAAGSLPADRIFGLFSLALAVALVTIGLLSSIFHLGRPKRAWRAFSQWRSSWLSREGIAALATFAPISCLAFGWIVLARLDGVYGLSALAATAMSVITVLCTGMIYNSLKPIRQWRSVWTTPIYIMLAGYTGGVLLTLLTLAFDNFRPVFAEFTLMTLALSASAKYLYWRDDSQKRLSPTLVTATGLTRFRELHLFDAPHTESNFVMNEMGYVIARKHADKLRGFVWLVLFALPAVSLCLVLTSTPGHSALAILSASIAALGATAGVAVERWLFFAEATHDSMIYYGGTA